MKRLSAGILIFLCGGITMGHAAKNFLTATSFPQTFEDLTFTQQNAVLRAGYEPFETDFDENGNCIAGCPYRGFTIQDQLVQIQENEARSQAYLNAAINGTTPPDAVAPSAGTNITITVPSVGGEQQPQTTPQQILPQQQPQKTQQTPPQPPRQYPVPPQTPPSNQGGYQCTVFNPENPVGGRDPRGEPLKNCPMISSPYGMRNHPVTGGRKMHNGVDLVASTGTPVFAVADGVVIKAVTDPNADACGKYIKVKHPNGMITVYCHLSEQVVVENQQVKSGCMIAKSGNTGRSTGPHLHYSVRLPDNQGVDPEKWMTCRHPYRH